MPAAAPSPPRLSSWLAKPRAGGPGGASQDAEFQKALGLMKARGLSNVEKAVGLLRQVHQRDDSVQVRRIRIVQPEAYEGGYKGGKNGHDEADA